VARDKSVLNFVFEGLQFARPFLAPSGVPAPVVAALRRGFDAASKDPALLSEAKKERLDVDPIDGATVQHLVAKLYATPPNRSSNARNGHLRRSEAEIDDCLFILLSHNGRIRRSTQQRRAAPSSCAVDCPPGGGGAAVAGISFSRLRFGANGSTAAAG